jgi:hypothetical protein
MRCWWCTKRAIVKWPEPEEGRVVGGCGDHREKVVAYMTKVVRWRDRHGLRRKVSK